MRGGRRRHVVDRRERGCLRQGRAHGRGHSQGPAAILVEEQIAWGVYGEASAFLIFQNPSRLKIDPATFDPLALGFKGLKGARNPGLAYRLRIAMLANGVDIMGAPGGLVSAVHGPREVAHTLEAFRTAVRWLKAEGDV